jgi:hypothetical protein
MTAFREEVCAPPQRLYDCLSQCAGRPRIVGLDKLVAAPDHVVVDARSRIGAAEMAQGVGLDEQALDQEVRPLRRSTTTETLEQDIEDADRRLVAIEPAQLAGLVVQRPQHRFTQIEVLRPGEPQDDFGKARACVFVAPEVRQHSALAEQRVSHPHLRLGRRRVAIAGEHDIEPSEPTARVLALRHSFTTPCQGPRVNSGPNTPRVRHTRTAAPAADDSTTDPASSGALPTKLLASSLRRGVLSSAQTSTVLELAQSGASFAPARQPRPTALLLVQLATAGKGA